jgi:NTP pyrophosphatase (non-canonical NTP hydrolase)
MDVYDLTRMGCGELKINSLVRNEDLSGAVPNFQSIKTLQPPMCMENGSIVYIPHMLFVDGDEVYLPVIEKFEPMNDGGYATIYKGRRSIYIPEYKPETTNRMIEGSVSFTCASDFHEICIKSVPILLNGKEARSTPNTRTLYYDDSIQYLIHEAFIHSLIQNVLIRAGFPTAVPTMHEILALTYDGTIKQLTNPSDVKEIWITMDVLNGVTLERFLRRRLTRLPTKFKRNLHQKIKEKENELILLDVFFQLACYLHILQENLRFNHRDMKIDNAFWRYHPHRENWKRNILVHDVGTWKCKHDFVLIDFGFGCISCGTSPSCTDKTSTIMGASSWFDYSSSCMKYGRDMAQFIYGLHSEFPLREYISSELFDVLDNATSAIETDDEGNSIHTYRLFAGIEIDGKPSPIRKHDKLPNKIHFNEGLYTFLDKKYIDVPGCRPKTILQSLATYARRYKDSFFPVSSINSCLPSSCI